jgi:hypothetical protein
VYLANSQYDSVIVGAQATSHWPAKCGQFVCYHPVSIVVSADPGLLGPLVVGPSDGILLKERTRPHVYVSAGRGKFWVTSPAEAWHICEQSGRCTWPDSILEVPPGTLSQVHNTPYSGTLVRQLWDDRVFLVSPGTVDGLPASIKRWVSAARFLELGFSWDNVVLVTTNGLVGIPDGPPA